MYANRASGSNSKGHYSHNQNNINTGNFRTNYSGNSSTDYRNDGYNSNRPRPFCEHCRRPGHTKDKCFKIHGYPQGPSFPPSQAPRYNNYNNNKGKRLAANAYGESFDTGENECGPSEHGRAMQHLTKEQYGQLVKILGSLQIGTNTNETSTLNGDVHGGAVNFAGTPARTVGWRDPGFIHTSFLKDLWPNMVYTYKLGHMLNNGSIVWSKKYSFKSPPFPGQESLQRIVIFGDMGKQERDGSNEYANYQPGSLMTTDTLIKDLDNIDAVFLIGDLPYANGYISQWDQFTAQVEPITSRVPFMIASGNHERTWENSGSLYTGLDSGGECGVPAETLYYVPAENRAKFWYAADYGMFHFCIGDTEHDWREGSEQYKFIEQCFASANRHKQPWLIFAAHRVLGYSSNDWYAKEGSFEEPMGREHLQKLWQKYKVDMAFFGHVHNYERVCPIYQNQCVNKETSHYSGIVNGTIHVVVGGGGSHLNTFTTINTTWSVFKDYDYGFVKLTAFNQSSLLFEYKKSRDGKVYDSFTISRDYKDVLACVHDGCEPTTLAS
ncbi:nucleotide pyrophosphatase/phosphodiesterase-like isoform X2 [Capsicum annuum]|uniref:nucleotide pyrophosphatase/phosphodiesterase-like isoform X2 n=1 Tax=Capsicum annuum TaxID=4072 RepID=UPI001FB0699A|nr:nucleotide pyrophosphatase/phosphodiesterase-like isoform X2 [Capsicum annuum]